jgi:hypothetical protein
MRSLWLVLLVVACGPSASQLRMQRVSDARAAAQRPGPRQAQDLASAIHDAYNAGDYKQQPQLLQNDVALAIAAIDRAIPNAGIDAATLVGWRALMFSDSGRVKESYSEFVRSFAMAPNKMAGRNLIVIYGAANKPQDVATTCQATFPVLTTDDDRLDLIALCRTNMNALSNEAEMSWMTPEQIAWYQAENARRLSAEIDAQNAAAQREREQNRIVRRAEQCFAGCKERGLNCQNRCYGDSECDNRCVEANHACVDRCEAAAIEQLGE